MHEKDQAPYRNIENIIDEHGKLIMKQSDYKQIMHELMDIKYALYQSFIVDITDRDGNVLSANEKYCEVTQYTEDEIIGKNYRLLQSDYHDKLFFEEMWATLEKGEIWRGEIRNRAKSGDIYWVDTTIIPLLDEQGEPERFVSIRTNITERKIIEEEIKTNDEMFRLLTRSTSDLISIVDRTGKYYYLSPSHEEILNVRLSSLQSLKTVDWLSELDKERIINKMAYLIEDRQTTAQLEVQIQRKNLRLMDAKLTINAIHDADGNIHNFILMMRDVTKQKEHEETIQHLAYHDALTNLPNRRHFMSRLREDIMSHTNALTSFAVILINIDRFKYINDSLGHEVGDYILIKVSERIGKSINVAHHISRLGGDEFVVILEETSQKEAVGLIAENILKNVGRTIHVAKHQYNLSCSIGIAIFPENGRKADLLLNHMDTALGTIKERGGGGYAFYTQEMTEKSLERIMLENELKKAIEFEQFHLDYQPKIDFKTNDIYGMEALVRWNHPDLGLIPPNNFISLAEEAGLILPLGLWVLREACRQNKEWQDKGYPPLIVSVNVSVKQLMDDKIVNQIQGVLEETGLDPQWLELEITESTFADVAYATTLLQEIGDLGVQISIDDFGTGYSSFNYIKHLPIHTLKIDGSFIRDIHENKDSHAIVKAILTLAKTIGLDVIAEGIEIAKQSDILMTEGCTQGQGYLFSRPLGSEQFEAYLNKETGQA